MRPITVSTDVYAAIWAARQAGEDAEDLILRRILKVPSATPPSAATKPGDAGKVGFSDPRYGISLPEGFEIFRVYKGTEYRARAHNGQWVLQNTGIAYSSLNKLSRATSGNVENAWQNWYYMKDGRRHLVQSLRP